LNGWPFNKRKAVSDEVGLSLRIKIAMMKLLSAKIEKSDLKPISFWAILIGAATMLTLAMGMRQSFGLFQPHIIKDLGITAADFSFAIAMQNIVWGLTQPFVGMLVDKYGARPIALTGAVIYAAGLILTILAPSTLVLTMGIGVCVGLALSCCASNVAMSVTSRTVSAAKRSFAMGAVSAAGSLGLMLASPLAQGLITSAGWKTAMLAFLALAAVMIPAAYSAGISDRLIIDKVAGPAQSIAEAVKEATSHPGYVVMAIAFFVCGLQLVFITTHLPNYLSICGIDPSVGAQALALIGLFNAFGSLAFGWLGGRYSKRFLLGGIYVLRSIIITVYFMSTPTPTTTLIFAAAMGSLWLGVVPLVNGLVIHLFGLRYVATLTGLAFFSHQVGSFLGAWGGGLIYTTLGSYEWAWKGAVIIGILAGLMQMSMNLQPSKRLGMATA
jgi:predicted MFS family arabinose efflux permease